MSKLAKRVTVKLPRDVWRALKLLAKETHVPMVTLIRLAVRKYAHAPHVYLARDSKRLRGGK